MKKLKLLILFGFLLFASSCVPEENENCHLTIKVINNSQTVIYIQGIPSYYDTTVVAFPNPTVDPLRYKVYQNKINDQALRINDCIEGYFNPSNAKSDTIMIFLFDAETLENTPWDSVASKYLVLQRYDLSLKDLQKLDWEVTYPPTPEMKDMKMYPPYKEQ